jgi:hypothetical protein
VETASFFRNSGVYIFDHYEVQIYDTDAVLKALQAQDFNSHSVSVDGSDRGIRGDIVNQKVRLYHELDNGTPKYWYGTKQGTWFAAEENVNGCVSGVPYKQSHHGTLADLQTAAGWINGSGSNTMVIQAEPVDPALPEAGVVLTVTLNGVVTWNEPEPVFRTGGGKIQDEADWYVYLQSHWGSGLKFTSAQITPLPPPSP